MKTLRALREGIKELMKATDLPSLKVLVRTCILLCAHHAAERLRCRFSHEDNIDSEGCCSFQ